MDVLNKGSYYLLHVHVCQKDSHPRSKLLDILIECEHMRLRRIINMHDIVLMMARNIPWLFSFFVCLGTEKNTPNIKYICLNLQNYVWKVVWIFTLIRKCIDIIHKLMVWTSATVVVLSHNNFHWNISHGSCFLLEYWNISLQRRCDKTLDWLYRWGLSWFFQKQKCNSISPASTCTSTSMYE